VWATVVGPQRGNGPSLRAGGRRAFFYGAVEDCSLLGEQMMGSPTYAAPLPQASLGITGPHESGRPDPPLKSVAAFVGTGLKAWRSEGGDGDWQA
jgi:hypothetical protein